MNLLKNAITTFGLGVVSGAAALALLHGSSANAQAPNAQPTWTFQVAPTTLPEAWKLNTRTGELQFCVHNGAQQTAFCDRVPNPPS